MGASCCTQAGGSIEETPDAMRKHRASPGKQLNSNKGKPLEARRQVATQQQVKFAETLFSRHVTTSSVALMLRGVGGPTAQHSTPEGWLRDVGATLTEASFRFQALMTSNPRDMQPSPAINSSSSSSSVLVREIQYFIALSPDVLSSSSRHSVATLVAASAAPTRGDADDDDADSGGGSAGGLEALFDRSALVGGGGSTTKHPQRRQTTENRAPPAAPAGALSLQMENCVTILVTPSTQRRDSMPEHEKLHTAALLSMIGKHAHDCGEIPGLGLYSSLTVPSCQQPQRSDTIGNDDCASSWSTVVFTTHSTALADRASHGANITACQEGVLVEGLVVCWNSVNDASSAATFHDRQDWHWQARAREMPLQDASRALLQQISQLGR